MLSETSLVLLELNRLREAISRLGEVDDPTSVVGLIDDLDAQIIRAEERVHDLQILINQRHLRAAARG